MNDQQGTSAEMAELYFVRRRGKVEGPWRVDKLKAEVKLRKLSRFHEVSSDKQNWNRAESLTWLFPRPSIPTKISSEHLVQESNESSKVADQWHVGINGEEVGPMTTKEVIEIIAKRVVGPSDMVWQDGYSDWIALQSVPEFASLVSRFEVGDENLIDAELDRGDSRIASLATPSFVMGVIAFPTLAILGFLLGLVLPLASALFLLSVPTGLIAGILGILACREITKSGEQLAGRPRAVIGIITGFGGAIGTVLLFAVAFAVALYQF